MSEQAPRKLFGLTLAAFVERHVGTLQDARCVAVSLAMAQGNIASAESPQLIGWAIFCIFQLELRRWFSGDDLDLQHGLEQLRRTLNVCITGLQPKPKPRQAQA